MARAWEFRADEDASMTVTLPPRDEIAAYHLFDEPRLIGGLVERAVYTDDERRRIAELAGRLARAARANRDKHGGIDAFMHEYGLTSEEGIILMCLAEALLRIPDKDTADALIAEKIGGGQWDKHLGASDSLFVNASTFGLMLTGRVVKLGSDKGTGPTSVMKRLSRARASPSSARRCARPCASWPTISCSAAPSRRPCGAPLRWRRAATCSPTTCWASGPAPRPTRSRYFERYMEAIEAVGKAAPPFSGHAQALTGRPSVSIKLSALHPRFDPGKEERLDRELLPRLIELCSAARRHGLCLTVDAEEQDRLDLTLGLFGQAFMDPAARRLAGSRHRRAGLRQARDSRAALAAATVRAGQAPHPRAPRQGRLLGQRDQVGAGAGPRRLPGLHPQDPHRRVLSRLHQADAGRPGARCSRSSPPTTPIRSPRPASPPAAVAFELQRLHGMGEALYDELIGARPHQRQLPHLCAGRPPRRPRLLPRAPPARERRQHLLRQPPGRRSDPSRRDPARPRAGRRARARQAGAPAAAADATSSRPSA